MVGGLFLDVGAKMQTCTMWLMVVDGGLPTTNVTDRTFSTFRPFQFITIILLTSQNLPRCRLDS